MRGRLEPSEAPFPHLSPFHLVSWHEISIRTSSPALVAFREQSFDPRKEIFMKKMVLGASMILACLIFLVPPATAASVSHGAPELSAFLASLGGPAPVTAAKRPAIRQE